jgi:hypothetical protein
MPSFRFAACKRSLNDAEAVNFHKVTGKHPHPNFHLKLRTWRYLGASKREVKQWQYTPKILPIMQHFIAILLICLGPGYSQLTQGLNTNKRMNAGLFASLIGGLR